MTGWQRRGPLTVLGMLVLAACQAAATATPTAAPVATPVATATSASTPNETPTDTAAPVETFPTTPIKGSLDLGYDTSGAPFDSAKLNGVRPGQVQAFWYQSGGAFVIVYATVDLASFGFCPGNSIQTETGFDHVSNAPTAPEACKGVESTLAAPPIGVRLCTSLASGAFAYLTAIPTSAQGVLYASIAKGQPDGSIAGVVGIAGGGASPAGTVPEIDLGILGCTPVAGL